MFQRTFQEVLRFFGTIATSLAGLSALATAAGFLAERTRWAMLGFSGAPLDLNEYLFTGARFLAFLPGIVLASTLAALAASLVVFGSLLLAAGLGLIVLRMRRRRLRRGSPWRFPDRFRSRVPWLDRLPAFALVALMLWQFVGALFLFQGGRLRNVLFLDRSALVQLECGSVGLDLEQRILMGCDAQLTEHLGWAFLIVLVSAGALWLILAPRGAPTQVAEPAVAGGEAGEPPRAPTRGSNLLVVVNGVLFSILLILLPINYGALFLRNDFSVVEVTLAQPDRVLEAWPADGRVSLLHREADEFYLYAASARRVWMLPRSDIATLTYLGICGVFEPFERCRPPGAPVTAVGEAP